MAEGTTAQCCSPCNILHTMTSNEGVYMIIQAVENSIANL